MNNRIKELVQPITWPNNCNESAVAALRYLAEHPRPAYGNSRYNTEHLYQIASELMRMASQNLYSQDYVSALNAALKLNLCRIAELESQLQSGFTPEALAQEERAENADQRIAELEQQRDKWAGWAKELGGKLDAAEKRLATPVRLPDEFARLGENLRTQDNRVTSEPMFCVYQKREIVTHADYDHDRIVWIDDDGVEANERQRMRLELLHDSCREVPDKWSRIAVKEIDEFVTCCFTEKGCKAYLACNGHNLRLPFIYVKSGFRNAEYIAIRNWLMTTGFKVEGDA